MQILVVSATSLEIAPFLSGDIYCDYLITGVGSPACLYHLGKKLQTKKYEVVVQAGIAGTFANAPKPGKCVLVKKDLFADVGVFEQASFSTLNELSLADNNQPPYGNGWLVNGHPILTSGILPAVTAITVNLVSDHTLPLNEMFKEKYGAEIESMEGAALHYLCLQEKVPFLQLRSISNMVGERDKSNWMMKEAINHLNDNLQKLLRELVNNKTKNK